MGRETASFFRRDLGAKEIGFKAYQLAALLEKINLMVFPGLHPSVAISHKIIVADKTNQSSIDYDDHEIRVGKMIFPGHYMIRPWLIDAEDDRPGLTPFQSRLWTCAHETRHRVQHLRGVRFQTKRLLFNNPFIGMIDRSTPAALSAIQGRSSFTCGLQRHYPGESLERIKSYHWPIERDAEIIALLTTALYRGTKSLKLALRVILIGAK